MLKNKLKKIANWIFLIVAVAMSISLIQNIRHVAGSGDKINQAQNQILELQKEQKDLQAQVQFVKSDTFVEKQLRDKLGLAKPGELVVVLPDAELVKKYAPKIEEEQTSLPASNWRKWLKLFL